VVVAPAIAPLAAEGERQERTGTTTGGGGVGRGGC